MVGKKEHETEETPKTSGKTGNYFDKVRANPWILSTIALGLVLILVLIFGGNGGEVVSADEAGQNVMSFLESNPDLTGDLSLVSTEQEGQFYVVTLSYQGQNVPVYTTLDGKSLVSGLVPLVAETTTTSTEPEVTEVPKSDKPVVEAFVFSYCPYGLQFQKALLPVYRELSDKADIRLVAIGAMHGEFEKTETLRQICIEKEYGKDKLWDYLEKFMANEAIGDCGSDTSCSEPLVNQIMKSLQGSESKIESCMAKDAEAIYQEQNARASALGIGGSPSFVINGAKVQVSRSPAAIAQAVCDAFNTAPEECNTQFDSAAASPSFGSGTTTGTTTASC